jgi:large subunit ribosomal protein L25
MVETIILKAERRQGSGTRAACKLRSKGMVPAIIYGHKEEPTAVQLDGHDLLLELQHHHRLLDLELDGQRKKCLVKEIQYDYLGDKVIHADLTWVNLDERVKVMVELELRGTAAGVSEGGTLNQLLKEVELECLVTNIPESIRILVSSLKLGETLTAGELELPEHAELITAAESPVATVQMVAEEVEEEEAPVEGEMEAEPEVIAREKEEPKGKTET